MPRQARAAEVERPTRSGPARSAATPHLTARATPAARPGPLHPTRAQIRDGLGRPRACVAATSRVDSRHRAPAPPRPRAYGSVYPLDAEDPPKMVAMLAACAALSTVAMTWLAPRALETRRRARLRVAQEAWAERMDRHE